MAYIDFLIIAQHAEVQEGKLYISGGGFTDLYRPAITPKEPAYINTLGVGIVLSVPWNETNRYQIFSVSLLHMESGRVLAEKDTTGFSVGRPPYATLNTAQRVVAAVMFNVCFPSEGIYSVKVRSGESMKHWDFRVHDTHSSKEIASCTSVQESHGSDGYGVRNALAPSIG